MKIKNVRIKEDGDNISLLADCKIRTVGWDTVYFTFDKKYKDYLVPDATPFAAGLLIPSMFLGQDLVIEGDISQKAYNGLGLVMDKVLAWWPKYFKRINVEGGTAKKDSLKPESVGVFFSGGVDSFYTYLKHKKDEKDRISHFILVDGSDIDMRNRKLWREALKNVQDIAQKENLQVITVATNLQSVLEPIVSPDYTHGGALAAIALCLRGGLKKIYIGASFSMKELVPYGTHPDLDPLWGTETTVFEHDGTEANRYQKIENEIAKSPLALDHLRVCFMNVDGRYNCGDCEKCVRTMVGLLAAGKLSEAKTFPKKIDTARLSVLISKAGPIHIGHLENLRILEEKNIYPEVRAAVKKGLAEIFDPQNTPKERIIHTIIYLDHMYLRGIFFKIWLSIVHPYQP